MILNTRRQQKYTFDLYSLVTLNDANGTQTYQLVGSMKGALAAGRQQSYLFTDEPFAIGDAIALMTDADGNYVFHYKGVPTDVYVHASEPVVDIYGRVTSYRSVLRSDAPRAPIGGSH